MRAPPQWSVALTAGRQVAAGNPLPASQLKVDSRTAGQSKYEALTPSGHAIEARVYAEDPAKYVPRRARSVRSDQVRLTCTTAASCRAPAGSCTCRRPP
jgi:hypothetical protein